MRFGSGLAFAYDETWEFIRRGWWVALVPLVPLAAAFFALPRGGLRGSWQWAALWGLMGLNALLQAALPYCVMRFVALGHDLGAALAVNRASARTYAPYLAAMAAYNLIVLGGGAFADGLAFTIGSWIATLILLPLLSLWSVTAPSGSVVIGPLRSVRLVLPHLLWAIVFLVCALIPIGLLQFLSSTALAMALYSSAAVSFYSAAAWTVQLLFNAAIDLLLIVAQFVVARKAGVRIGADRSLAAVFD